MKSGLVALHKDNFSESFHYVLVEQKFISECSIYLTTPMQTVTCIKIVYIEKFWSIDRNLWFMEIMSCDY